MTRHYLCIYSSENVKRHVTAGKVYIVKDDILVSDDGSRLSVVSPSSKYFHEIPANYTDKDLFALCLKLGVSR